jgi:hypothetical protein
MMARTLSARVRARALATSSVVVILGAVAMSHPAAAEQAPSACGPHPDVVKALGDRFHETQSATALTSAGTLLEVLTATDGSTWTIIVSRPDGLSCVVAAGQNWQERSNQAATSIAF